MPPVPHNLCDELAKLASQHNLKSSAIQTFPWSWLREFRASKAGLSLNYDETNKKLEVRKFPKGDQALRAGLKKGFSNSAQFASEQKRLSKSNYFTWDNGSGKWQSGSLFLTNSALARALCEWLSSTDLDLQKYAVSKSLKGTALEFDCMNESVELAAMSESEQGKISPRVAALLVRDGEVLGKAHRGQTNPGDHAEFILLKQCLATVDLNGATLYTTLEPCSTGRTEPKKPCVEHIVKSGISEVVIGMLDPDPRIYNKGSELLRSQGIVVRYYPEAIRKRLERVNIEFIGQFNANPAPSGTARFDYSNNNGKFTIGHGDNLFETMWSKGSNSVIHTMSDSRSIQSLGIAGGAKDFVEIIDASIYDMSSRVRTVHVGEIVVLRNTTGNFAAVKVVRIMDKTRPPDDRDEIQFEYKILTNGNADFSSA